LAAGEDHFGRDPGLIHIRQARMRIVVPFALNALGQRFCA
jgi:hypothetical protein